MNTIDVILHPVRLRIVNAMSGGRSRTTTDLCARLPDIPRTTLYRHVGVLAAAGILDVVDEQRVHGAVERHYRLRSDRPVIDAAAMSLDDHRGGFAAAMAALLAEFNAYLDRDGADPVADAVGYRQGVLWLDPDERTEMIDAIRTTFVAKAGNRPAPGRVPYLVSSIFFPAGDPE